MEITINELLNGKSTRIKNNDYLPTEAYVTPFLDRLSSLTDDFRVEVKLPDQITKTKDGDINTEDITYNRVWVQAVLPNEYAFENHKESISLLYAIDARKPIVKIFRNALNMACLNMCVWNPSFMDIKEIVPEKCIDFTPLERLMSLTDETHLILNRLKNTEIEYNQNYIDENLGMWIRKAMISDYDNGFGKVKLSTSFVIDAYKLLYQNKESNYYIPVNTSTSLFNIYNAFTQILSNDKKDIVNKFEKCGLISRILGISEF